MPDNVLILAGGQGKRMKVKSPKVLCEVLGIPMLQWVINSCEKSGLSNICVVKGYEAEQIDAFLGDKYVTALQKERLGTGHAVMQAAEFLNSNKDGNTLVLCGDAPFVDTETITSALAFHNGNKNSVTVVTSEISNPTGYGRIIRNNNGISAIVEQKDANSEQLLVNEVNSGCFWFKTQDLIDILFDIKSDNSQGEYYLTDCITLLIEKGKRADAFKSLNPVISLGANDRKGLLHLNDIAREAVIDVHLENGVEFTCLDGVVISPEVSIGVGTKIQQGVTLRGKTVIGENCNIGPNCIIENTKIGNNVVLNNVQSYDAVLENNISIGPFVQLRPNTHILDGVKIGDFVEIKNSTIGKNTAVAHLTYVGDSDVGANVNFGCGAVTANHNGECKFRTEICDNAFIGCNTNLVAPVKIGKSAYTAAGSTITKDVPDGALAIERGTVSIKDGFATNRLAARNEKFSKLK
ncbi:MAG: bifunctional UDP-N-acetylglucosamine diphosphorylase/glucosamine-1-phosphate N-acetyltransferase GlmU [Clostridiales bacterium]|nr:bifunctional UDP-N-acetylglucosamine diphosphorylase/glucosamine-1-phosphate N-acetyltransferase GlmU [Clostridiales bacterium]